MQCDALGDLASLGLHHRLSTKAIRLAYPFLKHLFPSAGFSAEFTACFLLSDTVGMDWSHHMPSSLPSRSILQPQVLFVPGMVAFGFWGLGMGLRGFCFLSSFLLEGLTDPNTCSSVHALCLLSARTDLLLFFPDSSCCVWRVFPLH